MNTSTPEAIRLEAHTASFRVACVETAAETIGRLRPGVRIIGLTKGQFSLLDLIRAVLDQIGAADVVLSTWTMGIRDVEHARWLIDTGQIRSLRILVDRSFATRQPAYAERIVELFGDGAIRASNTHAKFAVLRNDGWSIAIRASMNLNRNKRWEQFDLDDDAKICEFLGRLAAELESLTPPGPAPGGPVVEDVFSRALRDATCGNRIIAEMSSRERLARLGYGADEVQRREAAGLLSDEYQAGIVALEDNFREATISAALGGDRTARATVAHWIGEAKQRAGASSPRAAPERPAASGPMSIAAYARRRGVNRRTIYNWIAQGKIQRLDGGGIDPVAADLVPIRGKSPSAPVGAPSLSGLATHRAEHERIKAKIASMRLREAQGELVRADAVRQRWYDMLRIVRDRLLAVPSRAAGVVAGADSEHDCRRVLDREIRDALTAVADELSGEKNDAP